MRVGEGFTGRLVEGFVSGQSQVYILVVFYFLKNHSNYLPKNCLEQPISMTLLQFRFSQLICFFRNLIIISTILQFPF